MSTDPVITGGGTPLTTNRTFWPTTGGAVAFQPGWFQGHATAEIYINMGFGTAGPDGGPLNMSNSLITPFQILGPSKNPYPGTVCLPQVPMPRNLTVQPGDNATIQIVELAMHGAALYSVRAQPYTSMIISPADLLPQCVDITFLEPGDDRIDEVNSTNCFNSTDIGVADIYTVTLRSSGSDEYVSTSAVRGLQSYLIPVLGWAPLLGAGLWLLS